MEKLLTIKEAAAFLNVSEMSLRRWTNAGKLKCYRVGGNRERRFSRQDLVDFLYPGERGTTPLGLGDHKIEHSSHIAYFYHAADECLFAGIGYLSKGLGLGEKVLVVSTATRLPLLLDGLKKQGFPVEKLRADGSITVDSGRASPAEQTQFMTKAIAAADGPGGFRLLGDMTWALERKWGLSELQALENYTNNVLTGRKRLFLCQYDLERFDASAALMAFETHGLTAYRDDVKESPYFATGHS